MPAVLALTLTFVSTGDQQEASVTWALDGREPIVNPLQLPIAPADWKLILRALACGEPLDGIGDSAERARLLELVCERDLLAPDERDGYRFQIPLIATRCERSGSCRRFERLSI